MKQSTTAISVLWLAISLVCLTNIVSAEDSWRQLRGDNQGHAAAGIKLVSKWSETNNVVWKTDIPGAGWSSPVILDNEVWLTTCVEKDKSLRAICIEKDSGKIRVDVEVFKPRKLIEKHARNSHATPTPVIDDSSVYVHFGSYGTAALDRKTGEIKWKNQKTVIDHQWGPGSSPVLVDDLLVFNCDGRDVRYVIALDTKTGKRAWKTDRTVKITKGPFFEKSFSTPAVTSLDGQRVLLTAGANQFSSLVPTSGKENWSQEFFGYAGVAAPIVANGLAFVASGYGDISLMAVQLDKSEDRKPGELVWTIKRNVPIIPTPIVLGSELYMVSDDGILSCVDSASGKYHWRKRLKGGYAASVTYGDNKLFLPNDKGEVTVVSPSREKCQIIATNRLNGNIQATPALVDDSLFFRTQSSLYRIGYLDQKK